MVLPRTSLGVNLAGPLLHRFFGCEFDDEVLNTRVALPEYLACE
jgi:hypothetical protein